MEFVAVTGESGFIGKKLVVELDKRGYTILFPGRNFTGTVICDRVYHLACPSTTEFITENTSEVMDIILDGTRKAMELCPSALFINASSMGAGQQAEGPQSCYNVAKLCMEKYLEASDTNYMNYRLPSVYGEGMHDDNFIKRCVDGNAYAPNYPNKRYWIAHVDEVVDAMIELRDVKKELTTLGEIYEHFTSGRRGLHR